MQKYAGFALLGEVLGAAGRNGNNEARNALLNLGNTQSASGLDKSDESGAAS